MSKFHPLSVASVRPETRDAMVVTFAVPPEHRAAYRYEAGQHLTLRAEIGGEEVRRSYSICSAAQDETLRVAIKRIDDGLFSSWAFEQLKPGIVLDVMEPAGHFNVPLEPAVQRHHVAFAAGSGITPILSLIKTTLKAEPLSRFTLVYGNRASSSVIFKDELADLKDRYLSRFNVVFILSREHQDIDLFNGRIDAAKCEALLRQWVRPADIDIAYICGPQVMMEQVRDSLIANGVPKAQVKLELFGTAMNGAARKPRSVAIQGDAGCEVTVIHDGLSRQFTMKRNGPSLLDAALASGIELPYACKGGVCGTCRCKRVNGEVELDNQFALEDYELARGFVLSCQAFPVSDAVTLDFDQET
ncbi:MAG: phenylacetate-CoA oxygenase/reductase subunit PaaK [Gammaproteobacteria bacterium]|nr:phenylacetate-CoA oxygenase/reductase subunit PaaK [Gammaproteobacteria bacterium]